MENVVYLLGAGFSAPLGLPIMTNFMQKSKDLYFIDPERYCYFEKIFETVRDMHICKSYFRADLFNVEEILSILEMTDALSHEPEKELFAQYIIDVIAGYTPEIERDSNDNLTRIFKEDIDCYYGYFVASLFGISMSKKQDGIWAVVNSERAYNYSVITLNYDLVLENYSKHFQENCHGDSSLEFKKNGGDWGKEDVVFLSKIHGSVDTKTIVPPTWNKGLNPDIRHVWQLARNQLCEANHIRIIGYSLPITDAYIKYLLKSSIISNDNLKTIDVLCLDEDGSAKARYNEFVCFPRYRFRNANIFDYLQSHYDLWDRKNIRNYNEIKMGLLEEAHEIFFAEVKR